MALWKVTPDWKKSVIERQIWVKDGVDGYITHEIGWRWGEFIIETETDEPPVLGPGVNIFDYSTEDWSTDDGCWEETDYDVDEEQRELVENFFEDGNSVYDLEEKGWYLDDTKMFIDCEMTIERVEE